MNLFGKKGDKSGSSDLGGEAPGKYNEACALCGKSPTDKHWGNQFFHKRCFRKIRKGAKGML